MVSIQAIVNICSILSRHCLETFNDLLKVHMMTIKAIYSRIILDFKAKIPPFA